MELNVSVTCSDETIEIPLNKLLDYDYFQKVLSNGRTKMQHNKTQSVDELGNPFTCYTFKIPHLSVECSSKVLMILLGHTGSVYIVRPHKYDDELLEIMMYNDMYDTCLRLEPTSYNFGMNDYSGLVLFVKEKLPNVDPYLFVKNSGFWNAISFVDHSFYLCARDELDVCLIDDLLQKINDRLLVHVYSVFDYEKIIFDVLDSAIKNYESHSKIIKPQINDKVVAKLLKNVNKSKNESKISILHEKLKTLSVLMNVEFDINR